MKLATFHPDPLPRRDRTVNDADRRGELDPQNYAEPGVDGIVFSVLCVVGSAVVYFLMLLI